MSLKYVVINMRCVLQISLDFKFVAMWEISRSSGVLLWLQGLHLLSKPFKYSFSGEFFLCRIKVSCVMRL